MILQAENMRVQVPKRKPESLYFPRTKHIMELDVYGDALYCGVYIVLYKKDVMALPNKTSWSAIANCSNL